ncbi:AAA family ATPase [Lentzea sp. NPDC059081]|uniref:helix-turn-helix transcriptional regulator n=1 Tax=Lentzea sp. NPDC059081 TaxID=3346719 RepID=UPI00369EA1B5
MNRSRAKLRGRGRDIAELRVALAVESGCLVVVRGPAGIGRSAVLDATARELRANGVRVLRLRWAPGGDREPEDPFGIAPLVRAVRGEFEELGDRRLADSLGALVRIRDRAEQDGSGWAPQLVAELSAVFGHVAERGRTAVVLDDVHVLAEPTPLLAAARDAGCQVLVSTPDEAVCATGVAELLSVADRVVTLGPLADDDVADLVRQAAGPTADDSVPAGLRAALGPLYRNPATVLDTLAHLSAQGLLVVVHGRVCLGVPPARIGLPAGHHLVRRAEAQGELGPRLLFAAAVLDGFTVDELPVVAAALRTSVADCGRVFDALIEGGVLVVEAGERVHVRCPALAVAAERRGGGSEAAWLHAGVAERLLAARRRGEWVMPAMLADHLASSGTAVSLEPALCRWLLDLAAAVEKDEPESAARWCATALRHLPPSEAGHEDAVRSLVGLVLRTGAYELLDEVLKRLVPPADAGGRDTELCAVVALSALHSGGKPADERVRRLLEKTLADEGVGTLGHWSGWPLADREQAHADLAGDAVLARRIGRLRSALTRGPLPCGEAWQRVVLPVPSPGLTRLRHAGELADVGTVLGVLLGAGYALPRSGVLSAHHRVVRGYLTADWSAALSAARELELTGHRDTLAHNVSRLLAAEICGARGLVDQARGWLAAAPAQPRLATLRAWVETGLLVADGRRREAVALAVEHCAGLGESVPGTGLDRLVLRGLVVAAEPGGTEGAAALLAEVERLHRTGAWDTTPEVVFAARGLVAGDVVYLGVAADLVRRRWEQPALLEACLALARFADDPRPWLAEAQEIASRCAAPALVERVRRLTQERGVSALRSRVQRDELHPTEQRIIDLIGDGLTNRQIALELKISEKTVENRLTRLFARTGYRSRVQLAAASLDGRLGRDPQGTPKVV